MDRQLVRSGSCEIIVPEFELTLPASGRGQLTTVEGLIRDVVGDLSLDQPLRRVQDTESYEKIEGLLNKMRAVLPPEEDDDDEDTVASKPKKEVNKEESIPPFTVKLDDPSGNSWVEFIGSISDPKWNMRTYPRTLEQNVALGLISQDEAAQAPAPVRVETLAAAADTEAVDPEHPNDEVYVFPGTCSSCGHPVDTRMKKVIIPYFKVDLVFVSRIMSGPRQRII
jgi:zinc finger protein